MIGRAVSYIKQKGVMSFTLFFGRWLKGKFTSGFLFQKHFILEKQLAGEALAVYPTKTSMDSVDLRVVSSVQELNRLLQEGYELETPFMREVFERRLDGGQIGFLVFIEKDLAHSSWVIANADSGATTKIHPPFPMDYGLSAYIWYCVTSAHYRGNGLYPYTLSVMNRYLQRMGKEKSALAVLRDNEASLNGATKAGFKKVGEEWYIRLGKWEAAKTRFYGKDQFGECR